MNIDASPIALFGFFAIRIGIVTFIPTSNTPRKAVTKRLRTRYSPRTSSPSERAR